jgi:RNA polymerase sigma factor (sigma-70 family)
MAATAVHVPSSDPTRRRRLLRVGDDRLVARVRAGDDAAFEIIYDRYYRGLLAFCRQMLGSRHEAEDALQHSFASAYRALRAGAGEVDLRPWLYTIARNRCLSALRARRAQASAGRLEAGARAFEGMSAQVQLRADLRELVDELQRLPDDQRAALVLFELGDESHEQIAAVLGVRREKVKALVFQAREALMRARDARAAPCVEIREQLATVAGRLPRRGMARSHIDRCPGCAEFEREVRRQRTALAAILPLVPTVGLKGSVLGFALGGGGAVALGGAGAGGGATVVAGGALAAGGGGGVAGGAGAAAAGAIGTAGAATVATGLATGGGGGLASIPAKAVIAKVLAVVALSSGGEAQIHRERPSQPVVVHRSTPRPALGAPAPAYPPAGRRPASSVAAGGSPTAESSASAGSSSPSAPAPVTTTTPPTAHSPAALAPQTPAPSPMAPSSPGPAASEAPAAASAPATPSPDPAPSSAPAPAASTAPAAAPATATDTAPPANPATAIVAGSTGPATAAATDSGAAAGVATTAVDSAAVATAASASASTTP